jgi:outer membrane lipoprotein-sorting protein
VLYLVVDPATGQVTRTTVINSSGLSSTYAFSKLDLTSAIAPTTYLFDPASQPTYKVEVVK